jgi:nucleotide-binding universal stress UspA family protein
MNILMATDGSDCARRAIGFLLSFPFPDDCRITLLTVVDGELFKGRDNKELSSEQQDIVHQTEEQIREEGHRILDEEARGLRDAGREVTTLVRSGHPAEEIVLAAEELGTDLIVVGSHGLKAIKRFLLGSASDQVLHYAPCSVLIVKQCGYEKPVARDGTLRVLLAYDGSAPSREAVEFLAALPLGEQTHIHVLSVLPIIKMFRQDIKQRLTWIWQERKLLAEQALARITHEVRWGRPKIDTDLRESDDVSQDILETAARDHSDLIVLGYKGKGAIDRFLLGSVTTRIAHHAECSVLAVRAKR